MKLTTNIPANPELYLTQNDGSMEKFSVGNTAAVLMVNHDWHVGVITEIQADHFCLRIGRSITLIFDVEAVSLAVSLSDVKKIRKASIEDLKKVYFDEEEREFWMTHYMSRGRIVKRTPDDIAALRRYLGEEKN